MNQKKKKKKLKELEDEIKNKLTIQFKMTIQTTQ